jgi:retron-type reverse transcriptase
MGLLGWLLEGRGHSVDELARRLGVEPAELKAAGPQYREFTIPKRSGGKRRILAPVPGLKALQRRILRRLLARLRVHPAAMGFERGRSIVDNARAHVGRAVVMRFDLRDFFPSTGAKRLRRYFRRIGWNRPAAKLLVRLCTHEGGLPQGAPTSPRLSNLVNYRLDARLAGMAATIGAVYTRYADDITVSFAEDDRERVHYMQRFVRRVVESEGYQLHHRKKLSIRRRHHRQVVTGLVVNERVNLPRDVRRRLRAVEHRTRLGQRSILDNYQAFSRRKRPTLSRDQLEGWRAFQAMIARQASDG